MVKGLSRNARLNHNIKVFRVIVEDLIHSRDVNAEAAMDGRDPSLQASSGSKGNNWDPVSVAQLANLKKENDLYGRFRNDGKYFAYIDQTRAFSGSTVVLPVLSDLLITRCKLPE